MLNLSLGKTHLRLDCLKNVFVGGFCLGFFGRRGLDGWFYIIKKCNKPECKKKYTIWIKEFLMRALQMTFPLYFRVLQIAN